MKHLKLFESFREEDIHSICRNYGIRNYTINKDGSINIGGNVDLANRELTEVPIKFRNVTGCFYCHTNKLTSLEGCPESIGDRFYCYNNELTSFKGCPEYIGGYFGCRNNKIVTFEHLPFSIGSEFHCDYNPIFEVWKLFEDYSKIEFLNDCDALREPDANSEEPIIILDRLNFFLEEIGQKTVTKVKGYKCI